MRCLTPLFVLCALMHLSSTVFAKIDADPNKKYELTNSRGPWMIMVATFHSTSEDAEVQEGKSPEEAASELVLELRQLGLPAYVYSYDPAKEFLTVTDRLGREERRKNLRRAKSVCVVAGNYDDINDRVAQDSLEWVKKLNPKCLREGVVYKPTPGRPGPLSGAFLTINPLLSPEDVEQRRVDPLLVKLNNGERNSLFENKGEYTLVVARFYGKSLTAKVDVPWIKDFLKDNDLDNAALASRELVTALHGNYDRESGQFNNVDAYIWHDRDQSMVTVGSFKSANDPAIERYKKAFGPRYVEVNGQQVFQAAHFGIQGFGEKGDEKRLWLFEPNPTLMRVPKTR